ncbi:unnamed protein product [Sphagnum balticum]
MYGDVKEGMVVSKSSIPYFTGKEAHYIVNLNELMPNAHKYIVDILDDIHILSIMMFLKWLQRNCKNSIIKILMKALVMLVSSRYIICNDALAPLQVVFMFVKMCKSTLGMMVH